MHVTVTPTSLFSVLKYIAPADSLASTQHDQIRAEKELKLENEKEKTEDQATEHNDDKYVMRSKLNLDADDEAALDKKRKVDLMKTKASKAKASKAKKTAS